MASLRTMVGLYKDELREGIAHVAFWKEGRSWNASAFWLNHDDQIEEEDLPEVLDILAVDPNAILLNGYTDCPFNNLCDDPGCTIDFMAAHIKWRYEMEDSFLLRRWLPDQKKTEDKQQICDLLLPALQATRALSDLVKLTYSADEDMVIAEFATGNTKKANVAMDSGISMIKDIVKQIE